MIGSLVEKKGQAFAIRVIKNLNEKGFSFHLHLLGDGPKRKELETLRTELELTDFIHFQGNVDHPEIFLHKAFVYLHTANYEPLGLVLFCIIKVNRFLRQSKPNHVDCDDVITILKCIHHVNEIVT